MNTNTLNKNPWAWLRVESASIIAALIIGIVAVIVCWEYGWVYISIPALSFSLILFLLIHDKRKRYKLFVKDKTLLSFGVWKQLKRDKLA